VLPGGVRFNQRANHNPSDLTLYLGACPNALKRFVDAVTLRANPGRYRTLEAIAPF